MVRRIENASRRRTESVGAPRDILNVVGAKLRFNAEDAEVGVFFVDPETNVETRCRTYGRTEAVLIDFELPDLPPGRYTLEVRTRPGKSIRQGRLREPFLVVAG